ncbi:MAG: DUF4234 domain-containing protein [Clostridia bacterium]|nr:DUF4234 domain-containing protein [Clostridia bacterium]
MFCRYCGAQIPDNATFCSNCGASLAQGAGAPNAGSYAPPPPPPQSAYGQTYAAPQYAQGAVPVYVVNNRPAGRLSTSRGFWKLLLLSIVTLGIYTIVFYSSISNDINIIASRYDGKKTMHYCLVFFIFSWLTLGIVPLVWTAKLSSRIGNELYRRQINYPFGGWTFWVFDVLLCFTLVFPMIYIHRLAVAMNRLSADYNMKG